MADEKDFEQGDQAGVVGLLDMYENGEYTIDND